MTVRPSKKHLVIRQNWIESERGLGQSSAGYSFHLTLADMEKFNTKFWEAQFKKYPAHLGAPDWYEKPLGWGRELIEVSAKIYNQLKKLKAKGVYGLRLED